MQSNTESSNIRVGVRVRPPLAREIKHGEYQKCVLVPPLDSYGEESKGEKVFVSMTGEPIMVSKADL